MTFSFRSGITTLLVLGALVAGGTGSAFAAAKVTLKPGAATVTAGQPLTLKGTLTGVANKAKQTITLQADVAPLDGKFTSAGKTKTDKKGKFAFVAAPTGPTIFRATRKKVKGKPRG